MSSQGYSLGNPRALRGDINSPKPQHNEPKAAPNPSAKDDTNLLVQGPAVRTIMEHTLERLELASKITARTVAQIAIRVLWVWNLEAWELAASLQAKSFLLTN